MDNIGESASENIETITLKLRNMNFLPNYHGLASILQKEVRLIPHVSYDPKVGITILLDNMDSDSVVSLYCKSTYDSQTATELFLIFPIRLY